MNNFKHEWGESKLDFNHVNVPICNKCGMSKKYAEYARTSCTGATRTHDSLGSAGLACCATIWHGRGHQTRTKCELKGEHTTHRATYGSGNQLAEWEGDEAVTGFFDEPPE